MHLGIGRGDRRPGDVTNPNVLHAGHHFGRLHDMKYLPARSLRPSGQPCSELITIKTLAFGEQSSEPARIRSAWPGDGVFKIISGLLRMGNPAATIAVATTLVSSG